MPSRIVREGILTSERINSLSPNAELFYRRLMSVVDDFGRFSANLMLLRASCYPLKLDSVKEDSISKHLTECVGARLIVLYTVADKTFLELQDFRQQVRAKDSRYPSPDMQTQSTCVADAKQAISNVHLDVSVVEDVVEDDTRAPAGAGLVESKRAKAKDVEAAELPTWLPADVWREWVAYRKSIKKPLSDHAARLCVGKLDQFRREGHNPVDIINTAIMNCWQGFYLPNDRAGKPGPTSQSAANIPGML